MNSIIKSAEVFGSDAFVYHASSNEPELFLEHLKGYNPSSLGGKYGSGLYSVYNLEGTNTSSGVYGYYIYKLKVNLYGFISFIPEITRKIYGKDLSLSEQYKASRGLNKNVFNLLSSLDKNPPQSPDELSTIATTYLQGKVKGIIYFGESDGDCSLIYDAAAVTPISWRTIDETEWHKLSEDERSAFFNPDTLNSFTENKYNKKEIVFNIDKMISLLSEASGISSLNESMGFAAKRLAKAKPYIFLSKFSSEAWAQPFLSIAIEEQIEQDVRGFLSTFGRKPWAVNYLDIAANKFIKSKPCDFLYSFLHQYPWTVNYIEPASIRCIKIRPSHFLYDFAKEPWAQPYLDFAAKESIRRNKERFIELFSNEIWSNEKRLNLGDKSYIDLAKEGLSIESNNPDSTDLESESALKSNDRILKLAKLLSAYGLKKEADELMILSGYNSPRVGKKRWSMKQKRGINCSNPRGFSQKQYCKRKSRGGGYKK